MIRKIGKIALALSLLLLFSYPALSKEKALNFPQKPIRIIVPYGAGSGADMQARRLAIPLEKHLKTRVLIQNIPGADGRLGLNELWKAAPDGYTLAAQGMPSPITNEYLYPVKYKFREFTQIFSWSYDNLVLCVNTETWKTTEEFLAAAKTRSLSCGLSGLSGRLAGYILEDAVKFKPVNWVVFSGGGEVVTMLAGKHIDFAITTIPSARPLIDSGKLRIMLIFSNEKDPSYPNAPLTKDAGLDFSTVAFTSYRLAFGPPGIPDPIAKTLEQAFFKVVKDPDFVTWSQATRSVIAPMNRKQASDYVINVEREILKYVDKLKVSK